MSMGSVALPQMADNLASTEPASGLVQWPSRPARTVTREPSGFRSLFTSRRNMAQTSDWQDTSISEEGMQHTPGFEGSILPQRGRKRPVCAPVLSQRGYR